MRLTVEACCALERRAGESFDALTVAVNRGRVTALRWLLWAALQAYHAETVTTPEQAGAILDAAGGPRAMRVVLADFLKLNADAPDPVSGKTRKAVVDDRPGSVWRRLYLDARELGIPGAVFWRLSLRELWLERAAGRQALKTIRDRSLEQAWWTAALAGAAFGGKLPDLDKLLGRTTERPPQTWQQMQAAFDQIAGITGHA